MSSPINIIALHGNGGGGFRFARLEPYIPAEVRFEAVTLPGFAEKPRDPSLRSMRDYAFALRRESQLVHESGPKVLLGTGIGGSFALEYLQHFDDVQGLILHAPVGTRLDERWFPRLMRLPGMTTLGQRVFSSRLTRPVFKKLLFVDSSTVPEDYVNQFFTAYRRCDAFGQMFEILNRAWWESLRPLNVPTALLWGERERVLTVDQLEDYKSLLPHHIVRTVPNWDHFPMIEQPEAYAREIIKLARDLV
ncbi:MAG: alpha/beta hydrolase [Ardenticatenaceae bacterium]|nr:alpha/beta hydrolase [Ardenticatenaceae bacterium]